MIQVKSDSGKGVYYEKSSHRLKSISGTITIIVNDNNFDFFTILLLGWGPESHSRVNQISVIFIGNLRGLQAS